MNRIVGHYEILEKLGQGGMGVVYKARDMRLDRLVALKMLPDSQLDTSQRDRLVREARTASSLNHPNIVTIYDIDSVDEMRLIAMEYVPGKSLADLVQSGGLPLSDVIRYGAQIAEATGKAHAAGIIHRDLKPANIMVTDDGVIKILDFGLAKKYALPDSDDGATVAAALTKPGLILGTVAYMSPEQAVGESTDGRSDIFSLGVILYELLCGVRPFVGNTTLATLQKIQVATPRPVKESRPDLPDSVERIIRKALEKERARRYQSMQELRTDLLGVTEDLAGRRVFSLLGRLIWKYRRIAALTAIMAVLLLEGKTVEQWIEHSLSRRGPELVEPASVPAGVMSASDWTSQSQFWLQRFDRSGNTDRSIEAAKKALERNPTSAMAYATLGEAYYFKNSSAPDPQWLRLAKESARKAVELDPFLAAAHLSNGILLLAEQPDQARQELARTQELDPLNGAAAMWFGEYFAQKNDPVQAESAYKRAIELTPKDWAIYGRYGTFLYRNGRYLDAVHAWEQGRAQTPDNATILKNLGAAYHQLNQYEQAAAAFQRALEVQPSPAIYSNLGTARFFQGRYADSAAAFEKAVAMNPTSQLYWGNLGDAYRWTPGNTAKANDAYGHAIQIAQEKLAKTPDDPELRSSLAVYFAKSGDRQHAFESLAQLEKLSKRTAGSHFKALVAYEVAGNRSKALQALEAALQANYGLQEIKNEPELISLRTDRRYFDILAKQPR